MDWIENLKELFKKTFNDEVEKIENVRADGSNRQIIRLISKNRSVIGVFGPDKKENRAFVEFSKFFYSKNFPVPQIYSFDEEKQIYLETDLGDTTLFNRVKELRTDENFPDELIEYYRKALLWLSKFQIEGVDGFNVNWCYPRKEFDEQSMMWDLNYFKYYFLKLGGIEFDEQKLENDFKVFVDYLKNAQRKFFLYRDFQSRNIMIKDENLYFIDYQGGRYGFLAYDVASLLFDAKIDMPPKIREELLNYYLDIPLVKSVIKKDEFLKYYYCFVFIRLMQAMGAYGLRGFYERKTHFLTSIPYVIKNLEYLLGVVKPEIKIPEIVKVFKRITSSSYLRQFSDKKLGLNLRIYSFSYKDGIPPDPEGNNGGFVFDLRCLPNPGKDPLYSPYTGRDRIVRDFLDKSPEVNEYYKHCFELVNQAVSNYLSRNFTELYVAFGCTGGRHRSVYMAERLYRDFMNRKNVSCILKHLSLEKTNL
jgi:aminoglycoside/choline kinase family phosphotransferase